MSTATCTATGQGQTMYVLDAEIVIKISSEDTDGRFTVFEGRIQPRSGPPLHSHPHQHEWWYIAEGEFRFLVDGFEIRAGVGDTVFAPKGSRHTFQNVSSHVGRLITTVVPGGIDEFFADVEHAAPRGTEPNMARLLPIFKKHGQELLGPPL